MSNNKLKEVIEQDENENSESLSQNSFQDSENDDLEITHSNNTVEETNSDLEDVSDSQSQSMMEETDKNESSNQNEEEMQISRKVQIQVAQNSEESEQKEQRQEDSEIEEQVVLEEESFDEHDPEKNFPEYANEVNKELNKNILKVKKDIKKLDVQIDDNKERYQIMQDHYKNILLEIQNTQILSDQKSQEIEQEKHHSLVLERQIGKLYKNQKLKEENINNLREKLNNLQQKIFLGNQKLEKLKMEINWNQEEQDMWLKTVNQKEEDMTFIEKYKRSDDLKIKELTIDIQKLTHDKNKLENDLQKEITETQALQIEIQKMTQEFTMQNVERNKLYEHWDQLIKKIANKNQMLVNQGNKMVDAKKKANQCVQGIDEKIKEIKKIKRTCNNFNKDIKKFEKIIFEKKNENKKLAISQENVKADMKITQNRLSAFSSKFEKQKNMLTILENELIQKKKRLALVEQNYQKQMKILDQELKTDLSLLEITYEHEELLAQRQKENTELTRKSQLRKQDLYHIQKKLFSLKEQEQQITTEIGSITSNIKNLTTYSNKLFAEIQKQQEHLYNAEYQIQLLERKVARAHGERSIEETDFLVERIKQAKEQHSKAQQKYIATVHSMNQLQDEHRALKKRVKSLEDEEKKYIILIEKVNLENDMTTQELINVVKKKEEVMVQNNIMKLEINKIQSKVIEKHNGVLELQNKKDQMDVAMLEKEKEIQVHHSLLKSQQKQSEIERQKVAIELAERKNKNKNLQIKYQSLLQKKQQDLNIDEHSQAYYVIKASQDKEELERKQDEMQAGILKAESELKALNNTLVHLKGRNSQFREYHLNKNATKKDVQLKDALEDQFNEIGDNLVQKKKILNEMKQMLENNQNHLRDCENRLDFIIKKRNENIKENQQIENQQIQFEMKIERAEKIAVKNEKMLEKKNIKTAEKSKHFQDFQILMQDNLQKTLNKILTIVVEQNPHESSQIIDFLKDNDVELMSKLSSIDLNSQYSKSMSSSKFGVGSMKFP